MPPQKKPQGLAPFSLKDAPSFIERQFPVGRLSAEATRSGKQARPDTDGARLLLEGPQAADPRARRGARCLLPATDDPAKDLEIFLKLMAMDDARFRAPLRR